MKKKYTKPTLISDSTDTEKAFCLGCGVASGYNTVGCLRISDPDAYSVLTEIYGLGDSTQFSSDIFKNLVFSMNGQCTVSCYQNPYDSFFSS